MEMEAEGEALSGKIEAELVGLTNKEIIGNTVRQS